MRKLTFLLSVILLIVVLLVSLVHAKVIRDGIWCDGELFGVTVTPKDLPMNGPFDKLYNFDDSGLDGQRSVSESKPGDNDYNGGRWEVIPVTFTEKGIEDLSTNGVTIDNEITSDNEIMEQENMGNLEIGSPIRYFVCPLHPQK